MGWIVLEAALALLVLVFVIWWTMFAGRRAGEWHEATPTEPPEGARAHGVDEAAGPVQRPERGGSKNDQG